MSTFDRPPEIVPRPPALGFQSRRTRSADPNPINQLLFAQTAAILLVDSLAPEKAGLVDVWTKKTLKSLLTPGGWVLLGMAIVLHTGVVSIPLPVVTFLYYGAFTAGLLLAWRFHSSRVFLALLVLFLAQKALTFFLAGHIPETGTGRLAVESIGLLLPANFILLSLAMERGFSWSSITPPGLLLFVESTVVAVVCRPGPQDPVLVSSHALHHAVTTVPLPASAWLAFSAAIIVLLARFLLFRKPTESALLWSLAAAFLALHFGGSGKLSLAYYAAGTLILAVSIVETSYLLAYHDELTGLPSRRAFNHTLQRLEAPYSIAMVDIDHFKRFNDTYGHDTGDEVLRLVAARLARVTGGGHAYRCGGEEFAIVFPGKATPEVLDHLEHLRTIIEQCTFRTRIADRRQMPRGPDRRNPPGRGRAHTAHAIRQLAAGSNSSLSITVSIGVATSARTMPNTDRVIRAADKALYRAKSNGRNRVESASVSRRPARAKAADIA
jgi:GGDEF domain-containing protein